MKQLTITTSQVEDKVSIYTVSFSFVYGNMDSGVGSLGGLKYGGRENDVSHGE